MMQTIDAARLRALVESQGIGKSELARKSAVSRAQLGRILGGNQDRVRQSTLDKLAQALGVDPTELATGGTLTKFSELLARQYGYIDFRGLGMPRMQRQPLQNVFVDLSVREEEEEEASRAECPDGRTATRYWEKPPAQPVPATQCVRTYDRVVILGNPGAGKTTLLRYLATEHAGQGRGDGDVPVYVSLPELSRAVERDERVELLKFVAACAANEGCPGVEVPLREALEDDRRRCLVLLDGLDEVGNLQQKERLIECIQSFLERYPRNRFAITSRIVGFESAPWANQGFATFRILGYRERQLRDFAEKWTKILSQSEGKPAKEVSERLHTAIFANRRVRALASNPLILTILILLSESRGGMLPRRRVDLYEKVVDVFLDTWESSKRSSDRFDDTYSIDLDAREFRWLLSDVSLAMQKAELTLAPRWWLADKVEEYLQQRLGFAREEAKDASDRIIRYLSERTGLVEERGPDLFGFSHRTLGEYFASLGAIDEADASSSGDVAACLREYYFHPQWSEVVRLVAAQLTPPLAESLVSCILDDPDPVGRFLHRGQFLALRSLSDGTTVADRRVTGSIFSSLVELGESRWLGITLEAIDVLEGLDGTRLEKQAKQTVAAILEAAGKTLPDDEYECLCQRAYAQEISESAREQLPESFKSEAAREVAVEVRDRTYHLVYINGELAIADPDTWYSSLCSLLEDSSQSVELKSTLVHELGRRMETDRRSRMRLRKILCSDEDGSVRAASAFALAKVTKGKHNAKRLLLQVLDQDDDTQVRRACASALQDAAGEDAAATKRLMEIFGSDAPAAVRSGAAHGLARAADSRPHVREALQRMAACEQECDEVRVASARALEPQIGKDQAITDIVKGWVDRPAAPMLQRVAAQLLAVAVANERLTWDRGVVEKIEHILMNLDEPCPCALDSLEQLARAREIRHGLRLESVLVQSLRPVAEGIELAFVFGSTARYRQTQQSDIDLLVIGDVNLKELSRPLREAEKTLGRRINPAIYTRSRFREKYQAGDAFLLDVYRREKLPVIQSKEGLTRRDLDDELRAMVAEQMATTG